MFPRLARQATINIRRFSNEAETQLETWIKINDRMHIEAALKAEAAVSGVKADVAIIRAEVGSLKADVAVLRNDVSQVKSEINELRKGQVEIHEEISRIHDQISRQTRLILGGGATIAAVFLGASQYVESLKAK
jgi:hypothetical protein